MTHSMKYSTLNPLVCALALTLGGCISAPDVVLVDRATALEEQAAGSFEELELRLARAGMNPTPVPLTPNQLEDLGMQAPPLVDRLNKTPADRVDELLRRHCIGEGNDGLLADTRRDCKAGRMTAEDTALVQRVNSARQQLWAWMREQKSRTVPQVSADDLRMRWQRVHAQGVVCGALVQAADGSWGEKTC
ncbi:putative lipoprotein [Hylemonella gracilis ATCC 19624]|uniref:Putative lipoprotein n=2 Tax=Hylemonella gracilis TaxID=80880 RepID=F3KST8_9BURK|nr:putative lipoprotein [Hylemonella gracilis ATCC 19624]